MHEYHYTNEEIEKICNNFFEEVLSSQSIYQTFEDAMDEYTIFNLHENPQWKNLWDIYNMEYMPSEDVGIVFKKCIIQLFEKFKKEYLNC